MNTLNVDQVIRVLKAAINWNVDRIPKTSTSSAGTADELSAAVRSLTQTERFN